MENLVERALFGGIYKGRRVLVTGHTGFKGSWLVYWLEKMGAIVLGYSTPAPTDPAHIDLLKLKIESIEGDIRDSVKLEKVFDTFRPEIVFHLAAQPLVRYSYDHIDETFETNIMGSLRVYEACRKTSSVKAIISITTDKVYENKEEDRGFVEDDAFGGKDPYSASKGAMEVMTNSYRHSYFNLEKFNEHGVLLTTVRAGNVIGGGDWSKDRLIPDIIRSYLNKENVLIRYPDAVRPWQHVLECLAGYLVVGQRQWERRFELPYAFNFGPDLDEKVSVIEVFNIFKKFIDVQYSIDPAQKKFESSMLRLDCTLAKKQLNWEPLWNAEVALERTARWYRDYHDGARVSTDLDLQDYIDLAIENNCEWC